MPDSAGACGSARKNIYETFWRGQRFIKPVERTVRTRSMNSRPIRFWMANEVQWLPTIRYGPLEMPALKNIRHEKFVREYLKCDFNGAEAYRRVYPRHRPNIAKVSASRLLSSANLQRRLREVQVDIIQRSDITVDKILTEYEHARQLAIAQEKPEAMLNASEKKAKLVGLLVDRRETGHAGEFENLTDISEILEKVRQEAGLEAAEALARAFGLDEPASTPDPSEAEPNLDAIEPVSGTLNRAHRG
jgi:hypothetical protein